MRWWTRGLCVKAPSVIRATCSTPKRDKYNLKYYTGIARELQQAGVHLLAIKDMAGICRPRAVAALVRALKDETGLPVHFHTHDTSGAAAASVLAAVDAGCDAVDGALDAMSGLTSQPNLSAIAAALEGTARDPGLSQDALHAASMYWEGVRRFYLPPSSPTSARAPPTSTATRCPAASTPTCASRRARWDSSIAGRKCRRPMPK